MQIDDAAKATVTQRMTISKASVAAALAAGEKVDLDLYLSLASDAYLLGDLVAAREYLEILIVENALNPVHWNSYGNVLRAMGDYRGALDAYAEAMEVGDLEEYFRDYIELIETRFPDRVDEIPSVIETAIAKMGRQPWLMVKLAQWYNDHGDCDRAIAHYKVAVALAPDNEALQTEFDGVKTVCAGN